MARRIRPFDDSLQKDRRRGTVDQSTDTSAVDAYRQGVELTSPKHFANGIAKIHDGYNEQSGQHGVPDLVLGQSRPVLRDENSYLEMTKFDSVAHLQKLSPNINEINALLLEDVASKDGAIEPLELRDVITHRTHSKNIARKVWGVLDEGNVNDRASSEVFISETRRDDLHVGSFPFEDESDVIGDMQIASETISPDHRRHGSFRDNQENNEIIVDELTMETDLKAAVRSMRPMGGNSLPPTFVQAGATGFDFGFTGSGPATRYSPEYQRQLVTITRVSPGYSLDAGGIAVTITGTNFKYGATVTFGGVAASSVVVVSATTITCVNPAWAAPGGRVTVVVRNIDGMEASAGFVYIENEMQSEFRISTSEFDPFSLSESNLLYFVPFGGNSITLYNGATWDVLASDRVSLNTSGVVSGSNYDVFAYNNAGALALELSAAWTDDTTRADSLTRVDGTLTKTADSTRRYVGTVRSKSSGYVGGNFSFLGEVYVWNFYNRLPLAARIVESTDTWTYINPNSAWRQVRASTANSIKIVTGDPTLVTVRATGLAYVGATGAGNMAAVGVGVDSTTANSAQVYGGNPNSTSLFMTLTAEYKGYPGIGYRPIYWLETGVGGAVTYTFAGDSGGTQARTGMVLEVAV